MSSSQVTLWELILKATWADDNCTIYAKEPWERSSPAALVAIGESDDPLEPVPAGFSYFLEVFICKELIEDVSDQNFSAEKRFDLIVHYAVNDAYPSWAVRP